MLKRDALLPIKIAKAKIFLSPIILFYYFCPVTFSRQPFQVTMPLSGMMLNSSFPDPLLRGEILFSEWVTLKYTISFCLVLSCFLWALSTRKSKPRLIPGVYVVGGSKRSEIKTTARRFRNESKTLIHDGYSHTEGKEPFYVPSNLGSRLIIPTRYMEELKSAPIDKVDFIGTVHESTYQLVIFFYRLYTRKMLIKFGVHSVRVRVHRRCSSFPHGSKHFGLASYTPPAEYYARGAR